ncbi:S1C family serine protease [Glycomyces tritici]|uniref:Trypsin-like peptidase domain-containing protein n=1 Tax=Glycomyces tritici TaxID=2665176 RepID=A0ABT7YJM3_9ACTN|nr:trypsin-like peptidase domain-containing protein [Glycomyces tritici]MDN3238840.1 trypsin-like peptidase domain-containing protein [Glycomyces tritici]
MSSTESTKGPEGTAPQGPDGPRTPDTAPEPAAQPAVPAAEPAASLPPSTAPAAGDTAVIGGSAHSPAPEQPYAAQQQAAGAPPYPGDALGAAPHPAEHVHTAHTQVLQGTPAPAPAGAPHMSAPAWQPGAPVPPMYRHPGAPVGPPPRPRGRGKIVAGALALALIAGGAGGIAGWFIGSGDGATTTVQSVSMDAGQGMTYTEIVNKVRPSVVTIVTDAAEGSGVVYSKDGYIVTNNHVVDGAQSVEVRFSDGTTREATIVATDATQDLAVIQVNGGDDLTPVTFADSSAVQVGDIAVAIGSPLGLEGTVTTGIVSALDRSMTVSGEQGGGMGQQSSSTLSGLIQTDAAINSGNSGGALVNGDGELIGINTAIATTDSGSIGLGFSIPSNTVKDTVEQLIQNGSVEQGYLGVSVANTDGNGAMVLSVEPDSPAAQAGLQEGDVITAIDGTPVTTASEVVAAVQGTSSGTEVAITYVRDQQEAETTATLDAS